MREKRNKICPFLDWSSFYRRSVLVSPEGTRTSQLAWPMSNSIVASNSKEPRTNTSPASHETDPQYIYIFFFPCPLLGWGGGGRQSTRQSTFQRRDKPLRGSRSNHRCHCKCYSEIPGLDRLLENSGTTTTCLRENNCCFREIERCCVKQQRELFVEHWEDSARSG